MNNTTRITQQHYNTHLRNNRDGQEKDIGRQHGIYDQLNSFLRVSSTMTAGYIYIVLPRLPKLRYPVPDGTLLVVV